MDNLDEFSIKNINNVYNAPNETLNQYTINRNLVKLYENDKKMNELKEFISLNNIKTYIPNYAYKKNDIVWFKTKSPLTNKNEVFILRSIISDNIHTPEAKLNEKNIITFEESGWMDCQDFSTCVQNDISSYIRNEYAENIAVDHQNSETYHKYGNFVVNDLSNIILKRDLSNIDRNRRYFQYPSETVMMEQNNTITSGQYRKWDCGLIEYDITFKLGFTGNKVERNGVYYDEVICNNLELSNDSFYMEENDAKIFKLSSDSETIYINDMAIINHDDYVNVYSSRILFPVPFINENYMIFGSQFRNFCQDIDHKTIGYNMNSLTFTNRTKESICPIYITFTKDRYTKSAVMMNNFHCQILGRWK